MAGRGTGPDFVEALARGLDVLRCFDAESAGLVAADWALWQSRPHVQAVAEQAG